MADTPAVVMVYVGYKASLAITPLHWLVTRQVNTPHGRSTQ